VDQAVSVLLVDDDAAKRLAIRAVLSSLGYTIVEADSGLAALRCVMLQEFAVILLDVRMQGMDGFETAALIRQRVQSEMTPIIFVTAHASGEIDRYAQGAVDFICTPVVPDELRAKVSVFANLFIKANRLATWATEVETSADRLRLLTDTAPIGIFHTDRDNRYIYTNPRWTEITGMAAAAAAGQDIELDLRAVVEDVVDLLAGSAQAKGIELITAIETTVPAVVVGDPGRVRQGADEPDR
jgi:CheY-like chemotaxis protein